MVEKKSIKLTNGNTQPPLKFGEYKTDKEKNNMFVGANEFPVASIIPSSIGGTFSRVVSENE